MGPRLVLRLAGDRLYMEVTEARHTPAVLGVLPRWLGLGDAVAKTRSQAHVVEIEPSGGGDIPDVGRALVVGWNALMAEKESHIRRASELQVWLGAPYSRLGMMRFADGDTTWRNDRVLEPLVHAWAQEAMAIHPESQVIRWQRQSQTAHLLVSGTSRRVHEALEEFAQAHRLKYVGCLPSVAEAITLVPDEVRRGHAGKSNARKDVVLVTIEGGSSRTQCRIVHVLWMNGHDVDAVWRGLLSPQQSQQSQESDDTALDGVVRRFLLHHQLPRDPCVFRCVWPGPMTKANQPLDHSAANNV